MRAALAATLVFSVLSVAQRSALAQGLTEEEVKAAYLYNFARFAEWPPAAFATPASRLRVCTVGGATGLAAALQQIDGKPVRDRTLGARAVGVDAVTDCHLVYVAAAESARLPEMRTIAERYGILIVSEGDAALERGAMIAFRPVERRLGFAVDLAAVRRAGVKLPAQLLALAVEVRQ